MYLKKSVNVTNMCMHKNDRPERNILVKYFSVNVKERIAIRMGHRARRKAKAPLGLGLTTPKKKSTLGLQCCLLEKDRTRFRVEDRKSRRRPNRSAMCNPADADHND